MSDMTELPTDAIRKCLDFMNNPNTDGFPGGSALDSTVDEAIVELQALQEALKEAQEMLEACRQLLAESRNGEGEASDKITDLETDLAVKDARIAELEKKSDWHQLADRLAKHIPNLMSVICQKYPDATNDEAINTLLNEATATMVDYRLSRQRSDAFRAIKSEVEKRGYTSPALDEASE